LPRLTVESLYGLLIAIGFLAIIFTLPRVCQWVANYLT